MTMRLNRGRAVEGGFETGRRLPCNRFSRKTCFHRSTYATGSN
ncbi:hypothetical protein ALC53_01741 [Atta colombica]|uniref:Uncharacterized protein n=1 Tax=Atta colombica TaxID=520822 RepID=A0A195BU25_9HYME|nr:hypothetical protein ALC53_01741 [Atta colombica]